MKNLFVFLIALASLAMAQPVPVQSLSEVQRLPSPASKVYDPSGVMFSEKIYDFVLTNSGTTTDTIIGPIYDIRNLALVRHYDADAASISAFVDSLLGQAVVSCYDVSDSAAVTDSVNFRFTIQGSDYASDNSDPRTPYSDAWYTLRQRTITDVSASSAQVTQDTIKVYTLPTVHNAQFIRVYGENLSTAAQNDSRCRIWLNRFKILPN